jgi:Ca-activated chloride channel family protein
MNRTVSRKPSQEQVGDFLELACRAFMGGVAAALLFALVALVLSLSAQAAPVTLNDSKSGELLLRTATPSQYDVAPQLETEVAITVSGIISRTRVSQVFHNPGGDNVEGIYVFPLPEKAAMDHLDMRIGERVIEGQTTNSVVHIGPGEIVRVDLEYHQALASENGEYRLRFPLAIAPRYVPNLKAPSLEAMPDEPKTVEAGLPLQPDYAPGCGLVNPVDITVTLDAGVPLADVQSSYDEAWIEKQDRNRVIVSLAMEQADTDHDFELKWTVVPTTQPRSVTLTPTADSAASGVGVLWARVNP